MSFTRRLENQPPSFANLNNTHVQSFPNPQVIHAANAQLAEEINRLKGCLFNQQLEFDNHYTQLQNSNNVLSHQCRQVFNENCSLKGKIVELEKKLIKAENQLKQEQAKKTHATAKKIRHKSLEPLPPFSTLVSQLNNRAALSGTGT